MAGPAVPTNRDISSSIDDHTADHNLMAGVVDKFDQVTPSSGDVLHWNSSLGLYTPSSRLTIVEGLSGSGGSGPQLDARNYGVVANDSTVCDTPMANFVAAVQAARTWGVLPPGTIKLTAKVNTAADYGSKISGMTSEGTILKQYGNNIPILDLGATGSGSMHSNHLHDLQFLYNSTQSTSNTNAIPIKFSAMGYEGSIKRCSFKNGFRGVSVASGIVGFWGYTLDDLVFDSGITGSAISFADAAVDGVPNNHYGRIMITATNMAGPVLYLKGETSKIDTIEILNAALGPQLLVLNSGSEFDIDEIKVEVANYAASRYLLEMEINASARIGYLRFMLGTVSGSAVVHLIRTQGQSGTDLPPTFRVGKLQAYATFDGTAKGYGVQASGPVDIEEIHLYKVGGTSTGTWRLQDHGGSDTADWVQVLGQNRQRLSANVGNADYAFVHGVAGAIQSPDIIFHETAFTAQRTDDLPSNGDDLWNGLTKTIVVRNGAINGVNTLRIRVGSTILRTQTTDNVAMTWAYRRQSNANVDQNWKLINVANLA